MARALMWTLALGLVAWAVWAWPSIPVHFGLDGQPDRWGDRSLASWFALPLVGLAITAGTDALVRWSLSRPGAPGINLPNKEAILALPPDRRAPVLARVEGMIYGILAWSLAALALIQIDIWAESHGTGGAGWTLAGVVISVVGPLAAVIVGMVRIEAELKRQREA